MGMDVAIEPRSSKRPYIAASLAVIALAGVTFGVGRLDDAAPGVPKASLWIGTVQRGELLHEASAPGRLVPEAVRVVSASVAGSVEALHVKVGDVVDADTLVLELDNPELEVKALEVAGEVKGAEAALLDLRATLAIQRIEQRARVQNTAMLAREAKRKASTNERLAKDDIVPPLELAESLERAEELGKRLELEREHVEVLESATRARLAAQKAQVERLQAQQELREAQVAALKVRAGSAGVIQELPLEVGEQVATGTRLAKVVDPSRLRAELRIPETRAAGVALGQRARIDVQGEQLHGRVVHIDPAVEGGNVTVDVALNGALPEGARVDLSVDGRIEIDRLVDVLHVDKPASAGSDGRVGLFKLSPDGKGAHRVPVELGTASVRAIEVVSGLAEGDRVILSDMSQWEHAERVVFE